MRTTSEAKHKAVWDSYVKTLTELSEGDPIHATPSQRMEAIKRTLNSLNAEHQTPNSLNAEHQTQDDLL